MEHDVLVTNIKNAAKGINDIALRKNAEAMVELLTREIEGVEDAAPYSPPWMRLIQSLTDEETYPDGGAAGDFVIGRGKDAPLLKGTISIIPIALYKSRNFWDKDDKDKDSGKAICSSPDTVVGRLGQCKSCPHAEFEKGRGSDCTLSQNGLFVTSNFSHIFFFGFSKTAYKAGADFSKDFAKKGRDPFRTLCAMSSKKNEAYKGVYTPVVYPTGSIVSSDDLCTFTQSLFRYFNESRQAYIKAFREGAAAQNNSLPAPEREPSVLIDATGTVNPESDAYVI